MKQCSVTVAMPLSAERNNINERQFNKSRQIWRWIWQSIRDNAPKIWHHTDRNKTWLIKQISVCGNVVWYKARKINRRLNSGIHLQNKKVCRCTCIKESGGSSIKILKLSPNCPRNHISQKIKRPPNLRKPLIYCVFYGADRQIRTADLILTKDALCLLSYTSVFFRLSFQRGEKAIRNGIEPSTSSVTG